MTAKRFTIKEFSTLDVMSSLDVICDNGIELPSSTACDLLNALHEENEQLKERNNRQAKQLDNLYTLIEKQDWKTLKGIIQEFQECEEQIQQEWKCYE